MDINLNVNETKALQDILPLPSEKMIIDRFTAYQRSEAAGCNGNCSAGTCRSASL